MGMCAIHRELKEIREAMQDIAKNGNMAGGVICQKIARKSLATLDRLLAIDEAEMIERGAEAIYKEATANKGEYRGWTATDLAKACLQAAGVIGGRNDENTQM